MIEQKSESKPNQKRDEFPKVFEIIQEQAEKPPGNDPAIGSFYKGLLSLISKERNVRELLESVYHQRQSITPAHFVNLTFRSTQFILIYDEENWQFRNYHREEEWQPTLNSLFNSDRSERLREFLLTKDTVTTKYQRYAGPRALFATSWPEEPLKIADFGCGANHGLRGIEIGEPFEPIADSTRSNTFTTLLNTPIVFGEGLAVDKQNPENPEVKAWTIACSYYPKELGQIEITKKFEQRLEDKSSKVHFLKGNLLEPTTIDQIRHGHYHAVILSTLLYQVPQESRPMILNHAKEILRPDGIIVLQDFVKKDVKSPDGLRFDEPWFNDYGYRTLILPKNEESAIYEVFQWSDGRCHMVRTGEDFPNLLEKKK